MIKAVVNTVAKEGRLLVVAYKHSGNDDGPPWPLTDDEISLFKTNGMKELSLDLIEDTSNRPNMRFRVLYVKS